MKRELELSIAAIVHDLFNVDIRVELTRPDEQFGDYATNIALQLSRTIGKKPQEIAQLLALKLKERLAATVADVTVAGPGFVNITLCERSLLDGLAFESKKSLAGKTIVAEYGDPNPFKVLHAGHLYTSIVGDAIANLLENANDTVHRVNFGGDVGLHVAKTLWAMERELSGDLPKKLQDQSIEQRAEWLARCYVSGSQAYEEDKVAREAIQKLNKKVYQIHAEHDHNSYLAKIYWLGREWSYEYFRVFYKRLGIKFEKFYPESEVAELGLTTVNEQLQNGVYERSDGAVIFRGEKYGLHTRVFINSEGLPTYEAKDVGLIIKKDEDYHPDRSIIITGNEQEQYMAVVQKSVEQFAPKLVKATTHLTHGMVKLKGGEKMSSRTGKFLRATDVLDAAATANKKLTGQDNNETVLGAVKYVFLKNRIGGDIVFSPEESVSLEGNSGPYLQYAHARARSILAKAGGVTELLQDNLEADERSLVRKMSSYSDAVEQATQELMPHHLCTYLFELAQTFNSFYEQNRVIGSERQDHRLRLVKYYADTLKDGLNLLGISAPDHL